MSEWKQATVQSVAASLSIGPFGSRMKSDCYVASGVPVIRGNNISDTRELVGDMVYITPDKADELRSSIIYADDLFFPHRGSIGQVGIVPRNGAERYILSSSLMKLTCDRKQVEPLFLFYFFRSDEGRHELLKNASTVGTPGIGQPLSTLRSIRVPVPPLSAQRAITSILGALDDKIELNRRMNETLEAMARALFQNWFVAATQAGLPKGWREGRLGDLTGFLGGYAFKSQDWIEQGVPVVKIGSVKPGIVDLDEVSFVSDQVAEEAKRFRLSSGDLLIGMTGYVGEVGLVPPTDNPPLLNQRVGKFVLEMPGTSALGFLYCLTRNPEFKADVEVKSHGTAQANVSAEGILSIPVTIPPKALQNEFNLICKPVLDRILANHAESRTLAALRDALLPKLLSGELRVPVAAKLLEAHA